MGDFGVRKYDSDLGMFTSIDPLWEKYYGWSPYHYCGNDPVNLLDGNGKWAWIANNHMVKWKPNYFTGKLHSPSAKLESSINRFNRLLNVTFYNEYKERAPKVAEFLKNTQIAVYFANSKTESGVNANTRGDYWIGLAVENFWRDNIFGIDTKNMNAQKAAFLHELVHNMDGYKCKNYTEYHAFGAMIAAGYLTYKNFYNVAMNHKNLLSYMVDGADNIYFKDINNPTEEEIDALFFSMREMGNLIIGKPIGTGGVSIDKTK